MQPALPGQSDAAGNQKHFRADPPRQKRTKESYSVARPFLTYIAHTYILQIFYIAQSHLFGESRWKAPCVCHSIAGKGKRTCDGHLVWNAFIAEQNKCLHTPRGQHGVDDAGKAVGTLNAFLAGKSKKLLVTSPSLLVARS